MDRIESINRDRIRWCANERGVLLDQVADEAGIPAKAFAKLMDDGAGLTFVHFSEPDDSGHRFGWMRARYLQAIARSDRCLSTVMAAVEARADRDGFLVIATADHGGHGRRHGTHAPEDLHIPWVAWGSRVTRGDFTDPVRTTDTAATALAALGIEAPANVTGHAVQRVLAPGAVPP